MLDAKTFPVIPAKIGIHPATTIKQPATTIKQPTSIFLYYNKKFFKSHQYIFKQVLNYHFL
jgi:hypothetical protein